MRVLGVLAQNIRNHPFEVSGSSSGVLRAPFASYLSHFVLEPTRRSVLWILIRNPNQVFPLNPDSDKKVCDFLDLYKGLSSSERSFHPSKGKYSSSSKGVTRLVFVH
jgi:hypothetical protein